MLWYVANPLSVVSESLGMGTVTPGAMQGKWKTPLFVPQAGFTVAEKGQARD